MATPIFMTSAVPPSTSGAQPGSLAGGTTPAERYPVFNFDASADEYLDIALTPNLDYADGGLTFKFLVTMASATTGNVAIEAAIRALVNASEDLTASHTYVVNTSGAVGVNGTAGVGVWVTVTFTDGVDMDSWDPATDPALLRINRDVGVTSNAAGDMELHIDKCYGYETGT